MPASVPTVWNAAPGLAITLTLRQVEVPHDAAGADDAEQPDIVGGRAVPDHRE